MNNPKIYFAPLQGLTNADYRNLHQKYFGGIDKYYSPYLRFEPSKPLKNSVLKDLNPENNTGVNFIPQVLGADIPLFLEQIERAESWGYQELNWNLGCPYPMVTNRGFGSALVKHPQKVDEILNQVFSTNKISISVKCRLGFEDENEIYELLKVFNKYPLAELTVHTRTAKQMYKGKAKPENFKSLIGLSKNELVYNGDINSISDIEKLNQCFDNKIERFMIGRGLLKNPFLASEIKGKVYSQDEKRLIIKDFSNALYTISREKLHDSHLLGRMNTHWEYLSYLFTNQHKIFKAIKKTKRIDKFENLIDKILLSEELLFPHSGV